MLENEPSNPSFSVQVQELYNMVFRKHPLATLLSAALLISTSLPANAVLGIGGKKKKEEAPARKLTPAQNALLDKAIAREAATVKVIKERTPLLEIYIQNMRPEPGVVQVPESDEQYLTRIDFGKHIGEDSFARNDIKAKEDHKIGSLFKKTLGFAGGLSNGLRLQFNPAGFARMLVMDDEDFSRTYYNFGYVRNEFLGNVPTAVFDVTPIANKSIIPGNNKLAGKFIGRIWVETHNGNVVRFDGNVSGTEKDFKEYYHFDSWRTNVQPDLWLPNSIYVEETDPKSPTKTLQFKAINHIWGYVLKVPEKEAENTSVEVEGATDVSNDAQDVSPLGAQRAWVQQAEDNVIERLFEAGLLDAPGSEFDKTLEALASNILAYNNITVSRPIRVRTLMTEPLESLAVGNTIILSKGLIDTTGIVTQDGAQQAGDLNAALAFQLAHIILGHRLDTKYAFNDRLIFPDTTSFKHIPMHHTDADNEAAAKKAIELLSAKELIDSQKYFGLYLAQLRVRVDGLKALNNPMIGDGIVKNEKDSAFWMQALVPKADKLDMNDLKQQGAVPLASFLRFDPWTDKLIPMHSAFEPILSPADKMPFEVEPVYLKLSYYKAPAPPVDPATAPAPAPTAAAPATAAPDAAQPAATAAAPDATTGTATPPAPQH
jgi:hypothetical protein